MTKYLINAIGLALVAAGQSMQQSAASMPDTTPGAVLDFKTGEAAPPSPAVNPATIAAATLDAEGLPWDERLNASTKTTTEKGLWTKKKGVDDVTRATIVAQLRQKYPAPQPTMPTIAMPTVAMPAAVTPYGELCNWLAANTGDGKSLTSEWVTQQFTAAGTTLPDLATADANLLKQWLDGFKAVFAQMQA